MEHILALNLASSSNSTSFAYFQERTSPTSKVGSLWTSTSSLGFPGGSLGHLGTAGVVMFICRPLRPYVGSCCLEQPNLLPLVVMLGQ